MIKRWPIFVVMFLGILAPVLGLLPAGDAEAFAGRSPFYGYFFNVRDNAGNDVIGGGLYVSDVNTFVSRIRGHLSGGSRQNRTGAEFIVLTMLGYGPGTGKGVAHDPGVLNEWEARVRYYSNNGWVDWNGSQSSNVNSLWQGDWLGSNPDDVAWYNEWVSGPAITFHRPGSAGWYIIRKECGNPLGDLGGLEYDYSVGLGADRNFQPDYIVPGKTSQIRAWIVNNGPSSSDPGLIEIMIPDNRIVNPCPPPSGGCASPPGQNALPGGGGVYGVQNSTTWLPGPPSGPAVGPNWYWNTPSLANGASRTATLTFSVSPTATVGTTVTFDVYYYRVNRAGAVAHTTVSYRVVSERTPSVVGRNSDVHAGGGVCKQALSNGTITGFPGAGSRGEYVVSASGAGINNFSSQNGSGTDKSKLGSNGSYAQVCRPDLVEAARVYDSAGVDLVYLTAAQAADLDVNTLNLRSVYIARTGNIHLHGTVGRKVTVVALNGSVYIDGNVSVSNANYSKSTIPSLGIIARDNIYINAVPRSGAGQLTRVDAFMFANGTIETCTERNIACSTNALVINGFLMARNINFSRLGPVDTMGAPIAEDIRMAPQFYFNPPRLFDATVDDILLEGQGEKQPLF